MARLASIGFELNSLANGVEVYESYTLGDGIAETQSSIKRSGSYAYHAKVINDNGEGYSQQKLVASPGVKVAYFRFYLRIASASPYNTERIFVVDSNTSQILGLNINSDNTLRVHDTYNTGIPVGSSSSALNLDTWYRIEIKLDTTTLSSAAYEARIDGSTFSSGTVNLTGSSTDICGCEFGVIGQDNSLEIYMDDIAVNDNSGSFQNSWPGDGKIIHLKPNAAEVLNQWLKSGGGAGDTSNYQDVDEVTPDDVTTYLKANTTNQNDTYNIEAPSVIAATDTVNLVSVGFRLSGSSASANTPLRTTLTLLGGTTGTLVTPSSITWRTNADSAPFNYSLTSYDDLDSTPNSITKSKLDSAVIGIRTGTGNTNFAQVSTVWLLVDYTEDASKYTKENNASLPTNDTDLTNTFSASEETDVATDNTVYVDQTGEVAGYILHQFKQKNTSLAQSSFTVTWNGKSTRAPSSATVSLQVYNRTTPGWETIASNSAAAADTDFTLTNTVSTSLSDYYDENFVISARVYQQII